MLELSQRADHWHPERHQAGMSVPDLCCTQDISDTTFCNWRRKYGGIEVADAKRRKALEAENAKLKKLLAEQMMDVTTLKEMLGKKTSEDEPGRAIGSRDNGECSRRKAVDWAMTERSYSQRRACALAGIDPRVYRRRSKRPEDTEL